MLAHLPAAGTTDVMLLLHMHSTAAAAAVVYYSTANLTPGVYYHVVIGEI
jgi:hypothetical protein